MNIRESRQTKKVTGIVHARQCIDPAKRRYVGDRIVIDDPVTPIQLAV
jgi:hypothetical protein